MNIATQARNRVLVIEGNGQHRWVKSDLESSSLQVLQAAADRDGLGRAIEDAPQVVVLDVHAPSATWMGLLSTLRDLTCAPIIVLGPDSNGPLVQALERGADIYLTRQVSSREVLAYIRALLRRHSASHETSGGSRSQAGIPADYPNSAHTASWLSQL